MGDFLCVVLIVVMFLGQFGKQRCSIRKNIYFWAHGHNIVTSVNLWGDKLTG